MCAYILCNSLAVNVCVYVCVYAYVFWSGLCMCASGLIKCACSCSQCVTVQRTKLKTGEPMRWFVSSLHVTFRQLNVSVNAWIVTDAADLQFDSIDGGQMKFDFVFCFFFVFIGHFGKIYSSAEQINSCIAIQIFPTIINWIQNCKLIASSSFLNLYAKSATTHMSSAAQRKNSELIRFVRVVVCFSVCHTEIYQNTNVFSTCATALIPFCIYFICFVIFVFFSFLACICVGA